MFQPFSFLFRFPQRVVKTHMSAGDCPEILEARLEKEFNGSDAIEEQPYGKDRIETVIGQVFIKKIKVVTEVEVGFSPGGLGKGASANMKNS